MQTFNSIAVALVIIGLVMWMKSRRAKKPIKGTGLRILVPLAVMGVVIPVSFYNLMHIPGKTFHMPVFWELLIAALLGIFFGAIMLKQTEYERRKDGMIYAKPNRNLKYIIIALVLLRLLLTQYFKTIDVIEFSVLMMLMGVIYVGIWRIGSYIKFTKTLSSQVNNV